jgi:hypothetical protein
MYVIRNSIFVTVKRTIVVGVLIKFIYVNIEHNMFWHLLDRH